MAEYYNGLTYRLELDFNIFQRKKILEVLNSFQKLTA